MIVERFVYHKTWDIEGSLARPPVTGLPAGGTTPAGLNQARQQVAPSPGDQRA
ncbi:hypothetical protein ACYOEI_03045 [Singulisphaera rosea]